MKTTQRLLLLAPLLLAACVDDRPQLLVNGVCSPPAAGSCSFSGTCSMFYLGPTVVDVTTASSLTEFFEVFNQLDENPSEQAGQLNTHDAFVQGFDVSYEGRSLPTVSKRVTPQRVGTRGFRVVAVEPLTREAMAALRAGAASPATCSLDGVSCTANDQCCTGNCLGTCAPDEVLAKVSLTGVYGDGSTEFETAPYEIPIHVCAGCVGEPVCTSGSIVTCPPDLYSLGPALGTWPRSAGCSDSLGTGFFVNVSMTGSGTGDVTGLSATCAKPSAGTATCSGAVADATTVTLTANPTGGSTWGGWSGACTGTALTCDITVSGSNVLVGALFN